VLSKIGGNIMNWKEIVKTLLFGLVVSALCINAAETKKASDDEKKAYDTAYAFVTEESWEKALPALQAFLQKYPDSVYTDDAGYWQCYVLEQLGEDPEQCYDCYDEFLEKHEDSNWIKSVKSRLIMVSKKLEKLGKIEYSEKVESYEKNGNTDIVVEAIYALGRRDSEKSLEKLMNIYKKKENKKIRDAVLFALADNSSPKALNFLLEIAKTEKDPTFQKEAIFWIGQRDDDRALKVLQEIIFGNYSIESQKEALFAIASGSSSRTEKRVDIILEVIKKHSNSRIKNEAIFWMGQIKSPKVIKFLEDQAFADNPVETTKALLFALQDYGTPESLDLLIKIAKKHPNMEIKKEAIFWLGQKNDEKALKAIEELIDEL
jgi:HEAT repeat protein